MNQPASSQVHKEQHIGVLLGHLEKGWRAGNADIVRDFVHRWNEKVATSVEIGEIRDNLLHFTADLGRIRLNGTDEAHGLVLSGAEPNLSTALADMWSKINSPGRLSFVLTLSTESFQHALNVIPKERAVILAPASVADILKREDPLEELKRRMREQIPLRRLVPFNIKNSVSGHMFSGRSRLLNRLRQEDSVSFAVAGPSRIGKTSLLQRHHKLLKLARDPRMHSTFYIDFFSCQDHTPDGVARFIALKIDSSKGNAQLTADRLTNFFRFWKSHFSRPLELLLDEVDEVFHPSILKNLGLSAKEQLCRLVFAGKSVLLRAMLDRDSPLACRIDLLRMESLRQEESSKLLLEPLRDLGFQISEPQDVLSKVQDLSGNFPHLIQYFGSRLVELLLTSDCRSLNPRHVDEVRDSLEATSYFMSPFHDLTDPKERFVALVMLSTDSERMQVQQIKDFVNSKGVWFDQQQIWDICLALSINNILAFDNGAFRVANHGLKYYVNRTGFIDGALSDARAAMRKKET